MKVFTNAENLRQALMAQKDKKTIGFVPTMGALHKGHLSLVSQALSENDCAVVSIFVNPTQFDNAGDLKKYPRTLDKDVALLKTLQGTVYVFAPTANELYNNAIVSRHFNYGPIAKEMEGKHRDGHFDGVGTVVSLLLKAVNPNKAYFGQKDFQQLQIVKKLVELEKLSVKIIGCPIVREENGVAMSSRNKRLTKSQFEAATVISKTLKEVKDNFEKMSIPQLNALAKQRFKDNKHIELEYFEIANEATLKTVQRKRKGNKYRGFVAAFAGEVRLIDNMHL
ncbi:pantothenate synthetase [Patiriisocius marinistellae]|uniref:Pantothenate synthetase n=1 Tax=Patiriisocius marinistellae TaxID=2494560 RepID=A0A5J4FS14_9FLAO|nr:pantoate--beta-alanine ligase [Patiriisocius marinistellae]GEQ84647.1 pantothenate synthetase [Patiriisocius marinistellae]